jgi:chromosome segregation ATPase
MSNLLSWIKSFFVSTDSTLQQITTDINNSASTPDQKVYLTNKLNTARTTLASTTSRIESEVVLLEQKVEQADSELKAKQFELADKERSIFLLHQQNIKAEQAIHQLQQRSLLLEQQKLEETKAFEANLRAHSDHIARLTLELERAKQSQSILFEERERSVLRAKEAENLIRLEKEKHSRLHQVASESVGVLEAVKASSEQIQAVVPSDLGSSTAIKIISSSIKGKSAGQKEAIIVLQKPSLEQGLSLLSPTTSPSSSSSSSNKISLKPTAL